MRQLSTYGPIVAVLAVLLCPVGVFAQAPSSGASADEQQIRTAIVDFVKFYNKHDAAAVAALFAPDARFVSRRGEEVQGRDEIRQTFFDAFAARPQAKVSVVVDSLRFLTPDVAVEEGATTEFPDGETLATRSRYTVLHLKRDGRWQMQAVRVTDEEVVSAYGELQRLEWLVGDWIDEGSAEVVEAQFRWDENKSFLLQDFQVIRAGEVALKGTQRIGWDPQARQVRSWIFDSEGGFGEVVWTPVGDAWVCKATGVSADGVPSSATRTLVKVTNDRVNWSATDRLAGDESLPDFTATMVRKPPLPALAEKE